MLMVYLRLDRAIRPMQKRGERLFGVRRESYRVNQKNSLDRLLHAFPAMIAARWADVSDYSSNRRVDWGERGMRETKRLRLLHTKRYESYQLIRMVCVGIVVYQSSSLPFFFFFPPITPYYYYLSISLTPFHETDKLFHVPTPRWCDNCDNGKWQPTVLQWFFPPITLYLQKLEKVRPLASKADRRRELAEGSDWWMGCDYSRDGELTSFCGWLNM